MNTAQNEDGEYGRLLEFVDAVSYELYGGSRAWEQVGLKAVMRRLRKHTNATHYGAGLMFLDRLGWPVTTVKDQPVLNFFRVLIHTRKIVRRWTPPEPTLRACGSPYCDKLFSPRHSTHLYCSEGCKPPGPPDPPAGFTPRWGDDTEQPKPQNTATRVGQKPEDC